MDSASQFCGLYKIVSPLLGRQRMERWYIMVLVCYLDDAGTDPQNQFVSLSGYIGTLESWRTYEGEAQKVMDDFGVHYIRGRDLWATDGDYKGWKIDKKLDFITRLNNALAPCVGLALSFGTLKSKYSERAKGRTMIQSPYGFAFEMLFTALLNDGGFSSVVKKGGVDISFVIEEGNLNNDEIFQRYQRLKLNHGAKLPFFSGMAFADKNSSNAIQTADLFAFLTRRQREAMENNGRKPVEQHQFLQALRKDIRDIGRASTDFGYSDEEE